MADRTDGHEARLQSLEAHVLALAEEEQREHYSPRGNELLRRLEGELENLREVLQALIERGQAERGLRLLTASYSLWLEGGQPEGRYLREGREWFARFLALPSAAARSELRGRALDMAGGLALNQRVYARHARESAALASIEAPEAAEPDLYQVARSFVEESLAIRRELGDQPGIAQSLIHLGHIEGTWDHPDAARARYEESLALHRALGDKERIAVSLILLADWHLDRGDAAGARALALEGLAIRRELGRIHALAPQLERVAGVFAGLGAAECALRLAGVVAAYREASGWPLHAILQAQVDRWLAPARQTLDAEAQAAAWQAGLGMTMEQAADAALEGA